MKNELKVVEQAQARSKRGTAEADAVARDGANLTNPQELHQAIALLAYQRSASRDFAPGHELEDWLAAESEILAEREGFRNLPA